MLVKTMGLDPDLYGANVSREETKSTAVDVIEKAIYLTIMFRVLCGVTGKTAPGTHHLACRVELVSAETSCPSPEPEHGGVIETKVPSLTAPDDHPDDVQEANGTAGPRLQSACH